MKNSLALIWLKCSFCCCLSFKKKVQVQSKWAMVSRDDGISECIHLVIHLNRVIRVDLSKMIC